MKKTTTFLVLSLLWQWSTSQTNVWLGTGPQWLNSANWSLGTFPPSSCATDIEIPSAPVGGFFPIIGPSLSPFIGNLTMGDGATLTVGALGINVCGNISCGGTTAASFTGNGEVRLIGTGLQTISGKARFKKIKNENTATGVEVNGAVEVVERWVFEDGDLTNNGSITLLSDAVGTAYMDFFSFPGAANYNGSITVQKYIDNAADGYRDLSFPVTTTVGDLTDDFTINGPHGVNCWYAYSPYPTFQEYKEFENSDASNYYGGFWSVTNPATAIGGMKGYAARIYNAPLTIDVTGPMVFGSASIPLTNTPSLTPTADGWNLVGNPFCAPILWSEVVNQNPGITTGTCYRFSTTGEYAGTWNAHNGVTGVPLSTPDEISIAQGFFVQATGNATMSVNHAVCVASNTVPFYKTESLSNEVRIKLNNGVHADEVVTYTDPAATSAYDTGKDAVKIPAGAEVLLGFENANKELAIQVLEEITAATELPLSVNVKQDGVYEFSAVALNVPGLQVSLKDATTGLLYPLENRGASFTLAASANYSGRFSIVFEESISSVREEEVILSMRAFGRDIFIERATASTAEVTVSNLMGQKITDAPLLSNRSVVQVPVGFNGIAMVRVQEGQHVITQKLFIH